MSNRNNFFSEDADDVADSWDDDEIESAIGGGDFDDDELLDVDLRLNIADHYRAITRNKFFSEDTEAAQIVNDEVRAFIRERLEVLLGLRQENAPAQPQTKVDSPFSNEEVSALKALAAKVLNKPQLVSAPVMTRPEVQVSAPVKVAQSRPQEPTKKAPAKRGRKPSQQKTPAAKKSGPKTVEKRVTKNGKTQTLVEGTITERAGRRYQVVKNEGSGNLYEKDLGPIAPVQQKRLTVAEVNASNASLGPDYNNSGGGLASLGTAIAAKLAG